MSLSADLFGALGCEFLDFEIGNGGIVRHIRCKENLPMVHRRCCNKGIGEMHRVAQSITLNKEHTCWDIDSLMCKTVEAQILSAF